MISSLGISDSMENYLEVILELEETNRVARGKDIADRLGIKRGSVTSALKSLEEKNLINYEPYGYITLTREGREFAKEVTRKHQVLKDFLLNILRIDPNTAERLHPNDSYRIIRALETIESSGKTISEHHQHHGFENERFNAFKIGLRIDREKLYERIDQRVDLMIEAGLVKEVKKLLAMGCSAELKSMQSIGYRHVVGFLNGNLPWAECLRTLKRDTRRFAKRQFTWFGADPQINWYQPNQLDLIHEMVERFLK